MLYTIYDIRTIYYMPHNILYTIYYVLCTVYYYNITYHTIL